MDDAEYGLTAFGTVARISKTVVDMARNKGIKLGLIRPVTVWPFPNEIYEKRREQVKSFFDVEMNEGQMLIDVRLAVEGKRPVFYYGRLGGVVPTAEEILGEIEKKIGGAK